jgi:hypothetical protein
MFGVIGYAFYVYIKAMRNKRLGALVCFVEYRCCADRIYRDQPAVF